MGRLACVTLAAALAAAPAAAQVTELHGGYLFLPAGHWSVEATRRLDDRGLAPSGFDRLGRSLSRREVLEVFEHAAESARGTGWARRVEGYRARFLEEFAPASLPRSRGWMSAAAAGGEGRLRAGREDTTVAGGWVAPAPVSEPEALRLRLAASHDLGGAVGLAGTASVWGSRRRLEEAYAAVAARPLVFWLGRRAPGYGAAIGGSIVAAGSVAVDGAGVRLARPHRLGSLGPLRFQTSLARLERSGGIRHPWLWLGHASIEPHPLLQLAASRGAIFGGTGSDLQPIDLLALLAGVHGRRESRRENQVAAVHLRSRFSIAEVPLALYLEWGLEDSAGAWWDVPAVIAGVTLPEMPALPTVRAALEWASFAGSCCGNPPWYRHRILAHGWTDRGRLLGHPLGGHGTQLSAFLEGTDPGARLLWRIQASATERRRENLFHPHLTGRGVAAGGEVRTRVSPGWDLFATGRLAREGDDHSAWDAELGARAFF